MELLSPPQTKTLVSPSRISTLYSCPKKHDYVYNKELVPLGPSKGYFDKGNYAHELMHVYYQLLQAGSKPGSDYAVAQIVARIKNDVSRLELPRDAKLLPVYSVISNRIVRFIQQQSPRIDDGIEILGIEHELELEISERLSLFGYCDLVYRDKQGRLRIRDHKTGDKAWTKADAEWSNQLLFYAVIVWLLTGEIPVAEINYINTKDQVKLMSFENAFTFNPPVAYTQRELELYYEEICQIAEEVVSSRPAPYYANHCGSCAYRLPCLLERKGIDPTPVLNEHFVRVERASKRKHPRFSETTTSEDDSDATSSD